MCCPTACGSGWSAQRRGSGCPAISRLARGRRRCGSQQAEASRSAASSRELPRGTSYPVIDPATEQEIARAPDASDADIGKAIAAARHAFDETSWATDHRLRARCLRQLKQALDDDFPALQEITIAEAGVPIMWTDGPQLRIPIDGLDYIADLLDSYQWRPGPGRSQADGHPDPAANLPRARRGGRRDHAVELPEPDHPGQARPGPRGRLHGRAQAGPGHAVDRRRAGPPRSPSRPTSRPASLTSSPAAGRSAAAADRRPARRPGLVHRLDRHRPRRHGQRRRHDQEGLPGARRQVRRDRARRLRSRRGRRAHRVQRVHPRRPGLRA